MALSFADYRSTGYFRGLNGLRGVAICAVVWHHCYYAKAPVLSRGFLGVDLFFIISGFLIVTLLLRERGATGTISLCDFWVRRALRLMPILYLLLAILALYYATRMATPQARHFFGSLPANAFYVSNWIRTDAANLLILWSLATEEQFYLVWPPIERFLRAAAWPILLLLILVNQLANFGVLDPFLSHILPHPLREYEILSATYTPICLGVVLARLAHHEWGFKALRAVLGRAAAPYIAIASLALLILFAPPDISGIWRLAMQLAMAALIGAVVLRPRQKLVNVLEMRGIARIGIISYGLYLYHLWGLHIWLGILTRDQINQPMFLFALTMIVSVPIAEISFRMIERPILAYAHRYRARRGASA
jgi:peptidoglycan/LPS O-acetylase OafA/YrhL